MREVINHHHKLGVDQIKLSMSGEEVRAHNLITAQFSTKRLTPLIRSPRFDLRRIAILKTRKQRHA
jgi:hypothetical protein